MNLSQVEMIYENLSLSMCEKATTEQLKNGLRKQTN
jgi:hypothetical protein